MVKALVLGASGIVGQHMRLCIPEGVEPVWYRRTEDPITRGCALDSMEAVERLLNETDPQVIVNLAGESNVDAVETDPERYAWINVRVPIILAQWCAKRARHYIHISTQAVFSGTTPPYAPRDRRIPVNKYGEQKLLAEDSVFGLGASIIRLTFILGVRPLPKVGRRNPLEAMIDGEPKRQVRDRFFSPLLASDAAAVIWAKVMDGKPGEVIHAGFPEPWTRFDLAIEVGRNLQINPAFEQAFSKDFPAIAPRPRDTTYHAVTAKHGGDFLDRLRWIVLQNRNPNEISFTDRCTELALFFGITPDQARITLAKGFNPLHESVTAEFLQAPGGGSKSPAELLDWYRTTTAYIWELSAYHEDAGFNYGGMVGGIALRLQNEFPGGSVLCLGDGIGDVTLACSRAGLDAWYHDLWPSRTAEYAKFRFWRQTGSEMQAEYSTEDGQPSIAHGLHALVSLDFLEHVPNVEEWVRAVFAALRPGGLFFAQNAFACGSGPQGAIPMHLAVNDHYEKDWDDLLVKVGFVQESSNWYRRKA